MNAPAAAIRSLLGPDSVPGPAGQHGWLDDEQLLAHYAYPANGAFRLNFVASVDGAAMGGDGRSGSLGTAADHRVFELLRRLADLVLVGAGTLRDEGYVGLRVSEASVAWREARGRPAHPTLGIVSSRLALDPKHEMFADAPVPPIVVTPVSDPDRLAPFREVATVLTVPEHPERPGTLDVTELRAMLHDLGHSEVLCEGGPSLFGEINAQGAFDELCLTLSPALVGGFGGRITHSETLAQHPLALSGVLECDDTLLLHYRRSAGLS
ncbi:hypothetical protein C5B85_10240 [Pseudoclavibacter sp. AY1F1]|uniref:dihydrofolate reductase family protein n=1 Tax=Pseudoclavibacter sp. AY1F1 TaxID=2080583 RepID=UPI000CE77D96|nr:dihydrofolate reductase family protein [Pseudoclavibacter sp. AY1F1]PPF44511.1 hypothetical protein C5B85_10240 [Pseudoclavibacter sp. AY1F1]